MRILRTTIILGLSAASLLLFEGVIRSSGGFDLIARAEAIVGRPATPLSYAGVARRTAYRTTAVVATTAVATTAAATSAAAAPAGPPVLEIGTAVASLPAGCEPATVNGVEYRKCGGVFYRPAYQGNTLVYVVSAP
ncbi:MAG: hypothetical protein KA196_06480 [Arenimonas sp.]|nr:hypothetical protein [Arenimonas sp.]